MHSSAPSSFIDALARRLAEPLPGHLAHREMSPSLAFGRHRGPAPADTRQAAVALILFEAESASHAWLPLTLRPRALKHHGGQISFPGGRMEPGETAINTALREFQEELGPSEPIEAQCLGLLTPVYVYASHNWVTPVVLTAKAPRHFEADPLEVDSIVPLRMQQLCAPGCRYKREMKRPILMSEHTLAKPAEENLEAASMTPEVVWYATCWNWDGHEIWGATAMILAELAWLLNEIQFTSYS